MDCKFLKLTWIEQSVSGIGGNRQISLLRYRIQEFTGTILQHRLQFRWRNSFRNRERTSHGFVCILISFCNFSEFMIRNRQCKQISTGCSKQIHQILGPFQIFINLTIVSIWSALLDILIDLEIPSFRCPLLGFHRLPIMQINS